jgi:hypothetical protein
MSVHRGDATHNLGKERLALQLSTPLLTRLEQLLGHVVSLGSR